MAKIKSVAQVIKDNPEHKSLIRAVINCIGEDVILKVNGLGMSVGFTGMIYYTETHTFAMRHRKKILSMLESQAEDIGEDIVIMVSSFGIFRNSPIDSDDKKALYRYLGECKVEEGRITNIMAWYAAEEVCRMFED